MLSYFPGGSAVKNPLANAGDAGSILGSERSREGNDIPVFYFFKLLWKKGGKKSREYMGRVADCE